MLEIVKSHCADHATQQRCQLSMKYFSGISHQVQMSWISGQTIISYSITPREGETERHFEEVDGALLNRPFEKHGCMRIARSESADGLRARAIVWRTEVFEKQQCAKSALCKSYQVIMWNKFSIFWYNSTKKTTGTSSE